MAKTISFEWRTSLRIMLPAALLTLAITASPALAGTVTVINDYAPLKGIVGVVADIGGKPASVDKKVGAVPVITEETATNGVLTSSTGSVMPAVEFSEQVTAKPRPGGVDVTIVYLGVQNSKMTYSASGESLDLPNSLVVSGDQTVSVPYGYTKNVLINTHDGKQILVVDIQATK